MTAEISSRVSRQIGIELGHPGERGLRSRAVAQSAFGDCDQRLTRRRFFGRPLLAVASIPP